MVQLQCSIWLIDLGALSIINTPSRDTPIQQPKMVQKVILSCCSAEWKLPALLCSFCRTQSRPWLECTEKILNVNITSVNRHFSLSWHQYDSITLVSVFNTAITCFVKCLKHLNFKISSFLFIMILIKNPHTCNSGKDYKDQNSPNLETMRFIIIFAH